MHSLSSLLGRLPVLVRICLVLVLLILGLYTIASLSSPYRPQTSMAVDTNTDTQEETVDVPVATPKITHASKGHYVDLAKETLTSRRRTEGELPEGEWRSITVDADSDTSLVIVLPLAQKSTHEEFVRVAKQEIVDVINTLFVDEPSLARVGVVGTFPGEEGNEVPAISIIVDRSASSEWGNLGVAEVEAIAQSIEVKPQFRSP